MPTVPQYRQQIQQAPMPNAQLNMRVTGEAAGGTIAAATQQLSQQAATYAAEEKRKADQLALLAADNKLAEWEASFMNDPQNGLLNRLGADAFTAPDDFEQAFTQVASEVEQGLANDAQRAAFANFRQQRQSSMYTAVQRHTARQMKSYEDEQVKNALSISKQNAISYFDDPDRVELEIARQIAIVSQYAQNNGLPAEYVQMQRENIEGETYNMVMQRMAKDSPLAARAFYERHKDAMRGEWGVRAEQIIESQVAAYEAEEAAAQIVGSSEAKLSVWLEQAGKIEDRDQRRLVREELTTRWREVELQRNEQIASAFNAIEDGGSPAEIDPEVLAHMSSQQRNALETRYRQVQRAENPPMTMDAERLYLDFLAMGEGAIASMSESDLLATYRTTLDDQHWNTVRSEWARAKRIAGQAVTGERQNYTSLVSNRDVIDMVAVSIGITPINESRSDWSDEQVQRYYSFIETFQQAVEIQESIKGDQLTTRELMQLGKDIGNSKVITNLRTSMLTGRTRMGDPVPEAALINDETPVAIPYDDIPADIIVSLSSMREQLTGVPQRSRGRHSNEQRIVLQQAYAMLRMIENVPEPDPQNNPEAYRQWHEIAAQVRAILSGKEGEFEPRRNAPSPLRQ